MKAYAIVDKITGEIGEYQSGEICVYTLKSDIKRYWGNNKRYEIKEIEITVKGVVK